MKKLIVVAAVAMLALIIGTPPAKIAGKRAFAYQSQAPSPLPAQVVLPGVIANATEGFRIWAENTGTVRTAITVGYFNQDGSVVSGATETQSVLPGEHANFPGNVAGPGNFRGTAVLYSSNSVAAVVRHLPATRSGALSVSSGYPVSSDSASTVSLPYVANALDGTYNTLMTLANRGTHVACVQVAYSFVPGAGSVDAGGHPVLNDAGSGGGSCTAGYPIPVNGQLTFGPANAGAGITPMPAGTLNALMSATITSSGGAVAANVFGYLTGGLLKGEWYSGFAVQPPAAGATRSDDLGTEISIPIALKTADGYYSQILMSNPNPDPASVSIDYVSGSNKYTVKLTVPANGVANHGVYSDDTVPVGFVGAASVHSTQPLAAVVFRSKMTTAGSLVDEDLYTAMNGTPTSKGATKVYLPTISRRQSRDATHDGLNTWVGVAVVGGGTANLTLTTVGSSTTAPVCTNVGAFTALKKVTGSFVFYQNLDTDNGLGSNPDCLAGAMTITSDVPIIVVGDVIDDVFSGDQEAGYNAIRGS